MKWFLALVLFFTLIIDLFAINECKTDIFYGNGIRNSKKDADDSLLKIISLVESRISLNSLELKDRVSFNIAYNQKELFFFEALEVLRQWYKQNSLEAVADTEDYPFYKIMSAIDKEETPYFWEHGDEKWQSLQETMDKKIREMSEEVYYSDEDLQTHIDAYKERTGEGHNIVVVTHSQGNFYGNYAYGSLDDTEKSKFEIVATATPASYVAGSEQWTTLESDPIRLIPGSLHANTSNPDGVVEPTTNETIGKGHNFIRAYLDGFNSRAKIGNQLAEIANSFETSSSAWSIISKENEKSCDYRVTLQNPSTGETISGVYPFNEEGKLYQLPSGENVLASCGGSAIESSWKGQEENQCFKLVGTNEVISEQAKFLCDTNLPQSALWSDCQITVSCGRSSSHPFSVFYEASCPYGSSSECGFDDWENSPFHTGSWWIIPQEHRSISMADFNITFSPDIFEAIQPEDIQLEKAYNAELERVYLKTKPEHIDYGGNVRVQINLTPEQMHWGQKYSNTPSCYIKKYPGE